tara:strand:- start:952 stop:1242 length:291 start_codon:yes stop_codon:yes gene_type:complete
MDIHKEQTVLGTEISEILDIMNDLEQLEVESWYDNPLEAISRCKGVTQNQLQPWVKRLIKITSNIQMRMGLVVEKINKVEDDIYRYNEEDGQNQSW